MRQTTRRQPDERPDDSGTVRVAALAGIPAVLREHDVELAPVLVAMGLSVSTFDHSETRISYRTAGRLLQHCATVTGRRHFGLLAGQHATASSLGTLGELIQRSATVQSALDSLIAHLHLQTRGGVPTHSVDGTHASLGYAIYLRDMPGTAQAYDLVTAFEFNILKTICGPRWSPVEVSFAHAEPSDIRPYKQLFGCRLQFGADRTELRFKKQWLAQPPVGSDAVQHGLLQRQLLEQEAIAPDDVVSHVSEALRRMVANGRVNETLVCDLLATTRRTLHRKLAARGTTFRALVEAVRYEVARQLLTDTDMTTAELASSLDYADASAFNRAFRRWTDMPPAAWRARIRSNASA
ncbi:AraC family transcriptional regulator [Variovorax sp. J22P271]|uniref:AraC family transcriptional regulator n=1 Tax=Variovorax davisae TaxID=3053515 RepID=UPI002575757B|nr:AraC family transcriptional regulator [Variovorax sp. J22P271]MDM0036945.1 AraC family transcriptional regulator [Variovorax sp. J22P271]